MLPTIAAVARPDRAPVDRARVDRALAVLVLAPAQRQNLSELLSRAMNFVAREHQVFVQAPQTPLSSDDMVADVLRVLESPQTPTITIPEHLWWPLVRLINDAERHLGLILNGYEEEWIEGSDDVAYFARACAQAIGADRVLDQILIEIAELSQRQAAAGLPIVITS